jgi:hypothetical protein
VTDDARPLLQVRRCQLHPDPESRRAASGQTYPSAYGARPLAGFGAAPQPCLLRSMVRVPGITHPQHQSREAGSCLGQLRTSSRCSGAFGNEISSRFRDILLALSRNRDVSMIRHRAGGTSRGTPEMRAKVRFSSRLATGDRARPLGRRSLPPIQAGEAERLVAAFLAARTVTACPTRYAAPIEQRPHLTRSGY